MFYPDPGAWRLQSRDPRHAASLALPSPLRRHAHQALRLFVTAGIWAAGLCLVIGSIMFVATIAAPDHAEDLSAVTHSGPAQANAVRLPGHAGLSAAGPARTGFLTPEIAQFSGHGDRFTPRFWVSAGVPWKLLWAYRCATGPHGQFIVADAGGATALGASISESGTAGHGITRFGPDGRSHYLVVLSGCSWTMKVVQSR